MNAAARWGSTHRTRTRNVRLLVGLTLITGLMVARPVTSQAVHTQGTSSLFELGPATNTGTTNIRDDVANIPDWEDIFDYENGEVVTSTLPAGASARFIADELATAGSVDHTTFSGSNKNDDSINSWNWATGNVPVKDDLSNVYAFANETGDGDLLIYAGLERLSPNGDSHIDIEFNQNEVTLDKLRQDPDADAVCGNDQTEGAGDGAPCEFFTDTEDGDKQENDFIVSLDYTKGGGLGSLEMRRVNADGVFEPVFTLSTEGCNTAQINVPNGIAAIDSICGFTNGSPIPRGSWPTYNSKGQPLQDENATLPTNSFAEFGLNITEILGPDLCFATFGVHTRSSASFTAELKDFAVGGFQVCEPDTEVRVSAAVTYTIYEENKGSAPLEAPESPLDFVSDNDAEGASTCDTFEQKVFTEENAPDEALVGKNVGDIGPDEAAGNDLLDSGETWQFLCEVSLVPEEPEDPEDPPAPPGVTSGEVVTIVTGHGIFNGEDRTLCTDVETETPFEEATIAGTTTTADVSCDADEQRVMTLTITNGPPPAEDPES